LIKHDLLRIISIVALIIFTVTFLQPRAQASESKNNVTTDTSMTFNESGNNSDKLNALKDIVHKKNNAITSSPPELSLSLNEKLQWFFSFDNPDFIDDPYESKDYDNYRATFGFHIAL